jgi:hypothetical protein
VVISSLSVNASCKSAYNVKNEVPKAGISIDWGEEEKNEK